MGRPKGSGHGKYGPPGQCAGDREYRLHYAYCHKLGRFVSWSKYLAAVGSPGARKVNQYGPPGAKAADLPARAHRAYCAHFKQEFTWAEYRERVESRYTKNKFGIPGDRCPIDAYNHRRFCKRLGRYVEWAEYRRIVDSKAQITRARRERKDSPKISVFVRPVSEIVAKIQAKALTARVSCA